MSNEQKILEASGVPPQLVNMIINPEGINVDSLVFILKKFILPFMMGFQGRDLAPSNMYQSSYERSIFDSNVTQNLISQNTVNPLGLATTTFFASMFGAKDPVSWYMDPKTGQLNMVGNFVNNITNSLYSAMGSPLPDQGNFIAGIRYGLQGLSYQGSKFNDWGGGFGAVNTMDIYDSLISGLYRDSKEKTELWGETNQRDILESLSLARNYGVLTGSKINDIPSKIFSLDNVALNAMKTFNTENRSEGIKSLMDIVGGDIALSDTGRLNETLNRVKNLSDMTNISVDIIKNLLATSAKITQSLGMSGVVGANIGLGAISTVQTIGSFGNTVNFGRPIGDSERVEGLIQYNTQLMNTTEMQRVAKLRGVGNYLNVDLSNLNAYSSIQELSDAETELENKLMSREKGLTRTDARRRMFALGDRFKDVGQGLLTEEETGVKTLVSTLNESLNYAPDKYHKDLYSRYLSIDRKNLTDDQRFEAQTFFKNFLDTKFSDIPEGQRAGLIATALEAAEDPNKYYDEQKRKASENIKMNIARKNAELGIGRRIAPLYSGMMSMFKTGDLSSIFYMLADLPGSPVGSINGPMLDEYDPNDLSKITTNMILNPDFKLDYQIVSNSLGTKLNREDTFKNMYQMLLDIDNGKLNKSTNSKTYEEYSGYLKDISNKNLSFAQVKQYLEDRNITTPDNAALYLAWEEYNPEEAKLLRSQRKELSNKKSSYDLLQMKELSNIPSYLSEKQQQTLQDIYNVSGGGLGALKFDVNKIQEAIELQGKELGYKNLKFDTYSTKIDEDINKLIKQFNTNPNEETLRKINTAIGGNIKFTQGIDIQKAIKEQATNYDIVRQIEGDKSFIQAENEGMMKSLSFIGIKDYLKSDLYLTAHKPLFDKAGITITENTTTDQLRKNLQSIGIQWNSIDPTQSWTLKQNVLEQTEKAKKVVEERDRLIQQDQYETYRATISSDITKQWTNLAQIQEKRKNEPLIKIDDIDLMKALGKTYGPQEAVARYLELTNKKFDINTVEQYLVSAKENNLLEKNEGLVNEKDYINTEDMLKTIGGKSNVIDIYNSLPKTIRSLLSSQDFTVRSDALKKAKDYLQSNNKLGNISENNGILERELIVQSIEENKPGYSPLGKQINEAITKLMESGIGKSIIDLFNKIKGCIDDKGRVSINIDGILKYIHDLLGK